ncbi:hypothetical protein PanWU01x14_224170, partial [Parasponia andersonii]
KPDELTNMDQFQLVIGKIIYLSHTRPDIAFTVSVVSQFMYSLGLEHYDAVCRILRYLKGTPRKGLLFENHKHLQVEVYSNVDWASSVTNKRSLAIVYLL